MIAYNLYLLDLELGADDVGLFGGPSVDEAEHGEHAVAGAKRVRGRLFWAERSGLL